MNIEAVFPARPFVDVSEARSLKSLLSAGLTRYKLRRQVAAERKQLAELPDELLKDMGIKREDAILESRRDPGDLPKDRLENLSKQSCR